MEIKKRIIEIGPSVELEDYEWIKTKITVEITGGNIDSALKKAELEYYKALELNLKIAKKIKSNYNEGKDKESAYKKVADFVRKRIESLSNERKDNE